jgi:hypothetical protein
VVVDITYSPRRQVIDPNTGRPFEAQMIPVATSGFFESCLKTINIRILVEITPLKRQSQYVSDMIKKHEQAVHKESENLPEALQTVVSVARPTPPPEFTSIRKSTRTSQFLLAGFSVDFAL